MFYSEQKRSEYNSQLWNSGSEANKELARKQKRRLHYVSNIYIVKDPKHPENEGKVFLFKFGKKIFEKVTQAMNPQFEDDKAIDPFDFWNGANFKLKIRKVDGYQNYDLSEFDSPSALLDDDDSMEVIWKNEFSLKEILDPKNFKSYEELKSKLDRVLGLSSVSQTTVEKARTMKPEPVTEENIFDSNETDEDLDYFSKLLDDE